MNTTLKMGCVVAAAISLAGCQSFPLTSWMSKQDRPSRGAEPQLAQNTTGALEEGRTALRDGNLSAAVASFRIAQLDRSTMADASNGLGVVYARLGRLDLAERYFQAAIMSDPENERFAANLLRLQQQVVTVRRAQASDALAIAAAPAPVQRPAMTGEALAAGTVNRVSRGEVQVTTRGGLGSAPAMSVAYAARPQEPASPVAEQAVPTVSESAKGPTSIVFSQ